MDKGQIGSTRVTCAIALLDRGWGRPKTIEDDGPSSGGIRITIRHLFEGRDGITIEGEAHEVLTFKGNGHGER